jgi:hypothetical protein
MKNSGASSEPGQNFSSRPPSKTGTATSFQLAVEFFKKLFSVACLFFLRGSKTSVGGILISYHLSQSRGKHALAVEKPSGSVLKADLRRNSVVNTPSINEKFNQEHKTSQGST